MQGASCVNALAEVPEIRSLLAGHPDFVPAACWKLARGCKILGRGRRAGDAEQRGKLRGERRGATEHRREPHGEQCGGRRAARLARLARLIYFLYSVLPQSVTFKIPKLLQIHQILRPGRHSEQLGGP